MATQKQMFPITYKPGILRDGSPFQGSYCTRGQWVRFFRGWPQNIGGMRNYVIYLQTVPQILPPDFIPTNCLIYYDNEGNKHILVGAFDKNAEAQNEFNLIDVVYDKGGTLNFEQTETGRYVTGFSYDLQTQFIVVISIINSLPTQMILCLGMKNYTDINSSEAISTILAKETTDGFFQVNFPDFVLQEATGGMLYVGSRLF